MFLADYQIINLANEGMIDPFVDHKVSKTDDGEGVISYGLESFGYGIRVANQFRIFSAARGQATIVDPKNFDATLLHDHTGAYCMIPPNCFALARSMEYFKMPRDVIGLCLGKSTYARCGIITNFTPFEPGWEGYVTIEISNTSDIPAKVYAWEGIAQVLFAQGNTPNKDYGDNGRYQRQSGITLPMGGKS